MADTHEETLAKRRHESIAKLVAILKLPRVPMETWGAALTALEASPTWHNKGSDDQHMLVDALVDVIEDTEIEQELAVSIGLVLANGFPHLEDAKREEVELALKKMREGLKSL